MFGCGGAVKLWEKSLTYWLTDLMTRLFVEQPLTLPESANYFRQILRGKNPPSLIVSDCQHFSNPSTLLCQQWVCVNLGNLLLVNYLFFQPPFIPIGDCQHFDDYPTTLPLVSVYQHLQTPSLPVLYFLKSKQNHFSFGSIIQTRHTDSINKRELSNSLLSCGSVKI